MEEWRPIEGWPYSVSNLGRIRRDVSGPNTRQGLILRGAPKKKDYLGVCLCFKGKMKSFPVHVLVAKAFLGVRPDGYQCAHLDGDPRNNAASNLRWVTAKENSSHRRRHGTYPDGHKGSNAKLSEIDVCAIRAMKRAGLSNRKIARFYKINPTTAERINRRITWKET